MTLVKFLIKTILTNIYFVLMLDRFVPARCSVKNPSYWDVPFQPTNQSYQNFIAKEMLNEERFSQTSKQFFQTINNQCSLPDYQTSQLNQWIKAQPEKVLDAPELKDDYYLNLLDWSSRGTLCIGLGERVYLYTPKQITELCCFEDEYVCSVSYHPGGQHLAVGLSNGKTNIYDVEQESLVRTLKGHSHRVSSAAFTYGLLYTGSKDSLIIGHDHRAYHHINTRMMGHRGEVCGLRHDACGLASGSNDNLAIVWDVNMGKPRFKLSGHKAAVKALAWCPWQRNLLATGGGSSDKTMRFWNIETGKCINVANTESQVCSLLWNKDQRQIVSSHGYSQNQLSIWKVNQQNSFCQKVTDLHGHKKRVLHMVQSPDLSTICTASADQTLRFWKTQNRSMNNYLLETSEGKINLKNFSLR